VLKDFSNDVALVNEANDSHFAGALGADKKGLLVLWTRCKCVEATMHFYRKSRSSVGVVLCGAVLFALGLSWPSPVFSEDRTLDGLKSQSC